jgi:hypothetical protein
MEVTKIQEGYFEFCLSLLQLLPLEEVEKNKWAKRAHSIRNQLRQAITDHLNNYDNPEAIKRIELEL